MQMPALQGELLQEHRLSIPEVAVGVDELPGTLSQCSQDHDNFGSNSNIEGFKQEQPKSARLQALWWCPLALRKDLDATAAAGVSTSRGNARRMCCSKRHNKI